MLDDSGTLWNFLPSDMHNPIMPMIPSPLEWLISQGPYGGGAGYPVGWGPSGVVYHSDPTERGGGPGAIVDWFGARPGPGGVSSGGGRAGSGPVSATTNPMTEGLPSGSGLLVLAVLAAIVALS